MEIKDEFEGEGEDRNSTKVEGALKDAISKVNSVTLTETIASYSRNRQEQIKTLNERLTSSRLDKGDVIQEENLISVRSTKSKFD